ncbi:MAG: pyrroloquinoline quinone biosynthesis protein PqqB [Aureispira sp.]|nr:pyrroloquinoline quinone biosynthesis protein PqqB [Aureispira sp.]
MKYLFLVVTVVLSACVTSSPINDTNMTLPNQFVVVLGIAQDAGYPQTGCMKDCCQKAWKRGWQSSVVSLGIVDKTTEGRWLIEATPDIKKQLYTLNNFLPDSNAYIAPSGVFLTHAHIGHYTGLMQLGREVMGANQVPVYAMPRMSQFLQDHEPWKQLLTLQNIEIKELAKEQEVELSPNIKVTPFLVPHRDELSETVGYWIEGKKTKVMFIPDIDKWHKWNRDLVAEIKAVDMVLIDGTFFQNGEIPGRDMSKIPHPFVEESMELLKDLPASEKAKVHFIHFNHTNPLLQPNSKERKELEQAGFNMAEEGMIIRLGS